MRGLVQNISSTSKVEKTVTWLKLISITGGGQIIVQVVALLSGILVIRLLPTQEYGLYTLANTMLGTMVILADGGISSGVMSEGGKVWKNKEQLGVVLATGLDLRKKFAIGSLLVAIPVLLYLLRHHGASWIVAILLLLCLIPAFFTALSGTILQIAPKLNQDILPLQKNGVISNVIRFILILFLFIFPWAFVAILAAGIAQIWTNVNLRKISARFADANQKPDLKIRNEILKLVKRVLPGSIFYCLTGQITIWLVSIFGNTSSVAQVGALGRLGMTLTVFSAIFSTLVLPRFARLPDDKNILIKKLLLIQIALFGLGIVIVSVTYLFPGEILWILGKGYNNLQKELVLSMAGNCLGLVAGASFGIATIRGWAINPLIQIPVICLAIIGGVFLIDISSLMGVLKFNLFVFVIEILLAYANISVKISRIN
ncbi:MAG: polysaccharide biosynthesis protein [Ferruginibacter sp.]